MTLHSLPIFVRLQGRAVILLGDGEAADAKRRLLERGGAVIVGEDATASLAVVAIEDEHEAIAAVARLKARGLLVNAVDRPALCDFTWPAIVDRDPVLLAIGTGGASAGLAAALRQRLEGVLPSTLGHLASDLLAARNQLRAAYPDPQQRRRALAAAMAPGAPLDPFGAAPDVGCWIGTVDGRAALASETIRILLSSADPDDLTLRQVRQLASADRVYHRPDVPAAILDRARADAARIPCDGPPADTGVGLSIDLSLA